MFPALLRINNFFIVVREKQNQIKTFDVIDFDCVIWDLTESLTPRLFTHIVTVWTYTPTFWIEMIRKKYVSINLSLTWTNVWWVRYMGKANFGNEIERKFERLMMINEAMISIEF